MGNCQAAEAATVVIQHPGNKIERIYWSVSARQVMDSNPGHYVAHLIHSSTLNTRTTATPSIHFKLLRPNDTLLIGQVYRLISFQDVLEEFAAKKCVKLGKLLMNRGALGVEMKHKDFASDPNPTTANKVEGGEEVHGMRSNSSKRKKNKGGSGGGQQWRPALQSIAEFGT
ncbi:hypothetical protein PIB30_013461 [Stylosanthes scabra]|uniref:DUF4228 domain protein n=1 Tax=Stylosanthes scabra TaxID=79078 RepID=A0ABU6Y3B6_9FABA|nr:hypothetical protein [Stylosanthes scabra]